MISAGWFGRPAPVILCILAYPFVLVAGQPTQPAWTSYPFPTAFEHINLAQGLSHGSVYATLQDRQGFLWFATENGLNRYDGFEYKQFHHDKGQTGTLGTDWVTNLLEDHKGNLWIGTNGAGLNLIDQETGKVVRYNPSPGPDGIPAIHITSLAEDSAGNVWIGTEGKGLFRLPGASTPPMKPRFESFNPIPGKPAAFSEGTVGSLHIDKQGVIWVGWLEGGGLWRLEEKPTPDQYAFEQFLPQEALGTGSPPDDALNMSEDDQGVLWIGSTRGLYSYHRATNAFRRYVNQPGDKHSLSFNLVRRVYRDRAGGMWIGTDGGGLDRMLPRLRPEDPPRFRHFRHDNKDPSSLTSNAIESIYEDRSNVLWVGTYFMGLNKLILGSGSRERELQPLLQYKNRPTLPSSLSGNMVNALAEDCFGNLWIGTDGHGLNRVMRPSDTARHLTFEHFRADPKRPGAIPGDVVTGLFTDSRKQLWMTTYTEGLVRIDLESPNGPPAFRQYKKDPEDPGSLFDNFLWAGIEDRSGRLWVGGEAGSLDLFDPGTSTFKHFRRLGPGHADTSTAAIFALAEDRYGTLWLATQLGLARFNPETGSFKSYYQTDRPGGLSDSYVGSLHLDRTGALWVGTNSGGLCRLAIPPWDGPEPQFTPYGVKDGLPSNSIMGILEDDSGQLWISTNRELCRFDPQSGRAHPFIWHQEIQGVSFIRNSVHRSPGGDLFFGGNNGFSLFRPGDIAYNTVVPPIALTEFKLFNQAVPLQERSRKEGRDNSRPGAGAITLTAKDYEFSFKIAAMHFVAPHQNQYAYMMEGLDPDWHYSGNNHYIAYTTLPAGKYVFRAKASNCDGIWGEEEFRLDLEVMPPWWHTWWFRTLLAALGAGAILAAIRLRLRALRKRNELLEEMVAEKTREMKDILDNIDQGLFTISLDGKVNPDFALSTNNILQVQDITARSMKDLFRMDDVQFQDWESWLMLVKKDSQSMAWKRVVRLSPVQILSLPDPGGTRYIQIGYQKMFDQQKKFHKLMILAQDVTEARRNEQRIAEEKKNHESQVKAILGMVKNAKIIPEILGDMESRLKDFGESIHRLPLAPEPVEPDRLARLLRQAHTVKGTAATFGFDRLAAICHDAELFLSRFRDLAKPFSSDDSASLAECLEKMVAAKIEILDLAGRILGIGGSITAAVPVERIRRIRALCDSVSDGAGKEGDNSLSLLLVLCRSIDHVKVGHLAEPYRQMLHRIGSRLGKKIDLRVAPENLEISPEAFMQLNEPIVHLLRNAADHGLEPEAERARSEKGPVGVIGLELMPDGDGLIVSVSDDGAGIDTDKVASKALALGMVTPERLAVMEEMEKAGLIFSAGLTTRDQVSDVSGRGVGMDVVAEWVKAAGGRIALQSTRGQGTRISLILPARFKLETGLVAGE